MTKKSILNFSQEAALLFLFLILVSALFLMLRIGFENSLDQRLYYTGDEAELFLTNLSDSETHKYIFTEILDLVLIFSYTGLSFILAHKLCPSSAIFRCLALAPGVFDLIETSLILIKLTQLESFVFIGNLGVLTLLKWICGGVLTLVLALRLVYLLTSKPREA